MENFYRAFECKFQGSRDLIKTRLKQYLLFIKGLTGIYGDGLILDLGCGRGEWLELMQELGLTPYGVDIDEGALQACFDLNLPASKADGVEFLKTLKSDSHIAITAFHVVEHLSFENLQIIIQEALRVLKPGGLLIMETPNPENIKVATVNFYIDPTHKRPIPAELLSFIPEYYGFARVKILRLQENKELISKDQISLLDVIEGVSPDYAVIAQKQAPQEVMSWFNELFEKEYGISLVVLADKFEKQLPDTGKGLSNTKKRMKFNLNMDKFPFGVNVSGLIQSEKGLGTAVRSGIEALKAARIPYILNNITDLGSANVDKTFNDFSGENNYLFNLIHVNPDVFVNFANEANRPYFEGHCNIGYWVWELDIFPEEWVRLADYLDEIWTPSDFSFQAISKAILKTVKIPVTKIPYCISLSPDNIPIGKEAARRGLNIAADVFMFLFIFDFQSGIERKNPFAVVEAFKKAFSPTDKAMLFLKTSHSEFNKKEFYRLLNVVKGYNITITDSVFTKEQIYSLMNACDCYVSLHRSEGFGLTIAEAMALGKPVIATGYSSNMDFMNQDDGFPVSYRLVEVNGDYGAYKKGNMWAEPDIDESADYMRRVFDNRGETETVGIKGREFIKKYYCPEAISEKYKGRLNRIIGGYEDRLRYRPVPDGSKIKIG